MQGKLTLRLEKELIEAAKRASRSLGKSVSQMVAEYFFLLGQGLEGRKTVITPRARSLFGVLAGSGVSEEDYKHHLESKHR
jgi:hypothetical protein